MLCSRNHTLAALLIVALVGAACVLIAVDNLTTGSSTEQRREFQQLVGGLGGGPSADLSHCTFSFDPRLCPNCSMNSGPIPGGIYFCRHHACCILYYPPINSRISSSSEGQPNAHSP